METSIHYGLDEKQLAFKLREKITSKFGIELSGKGRFNTVSGTLQYRGTAMKCLSSGPSLKDVGGSPLLIGLGVAAISGRSEPLLTVKAKKSISLLDGNNTVLSGKIEADSEYNGSIISRRATVKVSHKIFNFTKRQDLKVSAGADISWPMGSKQTIVTPVVQVRENNWALHFRNHRWSLTYDL